MANYRVEMDRAMCISCGNCIETCPKLWEFGNDGISSLIGSPLTGDIQTKKLQKLGCSIDGAKKCPVMCIHVYDGDNELI
ncbi:MAG: ferredoxin [Methanobacteriaceae archaeon]|jgi:ferredoxin|nr:ferredoxin [Methanobacteriaceae archaeon]